MRRGGGAKIALDYTHQFRRSFPEHHGDAGLSLDELKGSALKTQPLWI
jgi:hypothetical protein